MIHHNIASPNELINNRFKVSAYSCLCIGVACLLFIFFFAMDAFSATKETTRKIKTKTTKKLSQPATSTKSKSSLTQKSKTSNTSAKKQKSKISAKSKVKPKPSAASSSKARSNKKSKKATNASNTSKTKKRPLILNATRDKAQGIASQLSSELPDNLKQEIETLLGVRYSRGGQGQNGYDCSGLVHRVYVNAFGVDLPRSSSQLFFDGNLERISQDRLQTGDLLFFGPRRKHVNHVGMYLAGGYFLHASSSEGVTITRLDNGYWKSRWMLSKRVPGLEIQNDSMSLSRGLTKKLEQNSASFAYAGDVSTRNTPQSVRFIESGLNVHDVAEFRLSGFSLNAFDRYPYSDDRASSYETQRGFRLAAVFSPTDWLKLIPSVTQVTDSEDSLSEEGDYQKLGIETWMILPSSRMALFMAASANNKQDLFNHPLEASPDWQTLNVALGVHYYLSESLRISLLGSRAQNEDLQNSAEMGGRSKVLDDVSLQLNVRF